MKYGESKNRTEIFRSSNKVIKRTPISLEWSSKQIMKWVKSYYNKLKKAGIPVPQILELYDSSTKNEKSLTVVVEYKGTPLKIGEHLDKFFIIIQRAVKNKVYLDPHIKNFTYHNGEVYYVDLMPPLIEPYIKMRLKYERGKNKIILTKFLRNFSHEKLIMHSISDLYKENKKKMHSSIDTEQKWDDERIGLPLL